MKVCGGINGWLWLAALTGLGCLRGWAEDYPAAGPAWAKFDLTLQSGARTEGVGPFYYTQLGESERTWALPPFYSSYADTLDSRERDFLYPLLTYEAHGMEYRWQFLEIFSFAGGSNPDAGAAQRLTIYPFYFQQRSADTNENYTAVAPFYGHIKHRLLLPDVYFVMFPLYAETRKHGVVTDNYLYPFFHLRHGDQLDGWQLWPLIGSEHKAVTSATNGFGDVSVAPGHEKFFAFWPIYFNNRTDIGTDDPKEELGMLPFFTRMRSPQSDSTSWLWPFFGVLDDREKKFHEWDGPWPFVVFGHGADRHISRVWPFYSESQDTNMTSHSYGWALYQHKHVQAEPLDRQRRRVLFYLYDDLVDSNSYTGKYKERLDMWPFFTWHRGYDGNQRLQVLAPLEPAAPDNRGVDRNLSPVWSLWRSERNVETHCASQSLLWNLYRREETPQAKKSSLLFGLFQYKEEGGKKQLRCFYATAFHWRPRANEHGGRPTN